MKKSITIVLAILCIKATCQDLPQKQLKVETSPGHGYEIIYMSNPIEKNVNIMDGGYLKHLKKEFYRENKYTWDETVKLIDSVGADWHLPSIYELKAIYKTMQKELTDKNISIGNLQWQGLYLNYWCCNSSSHINIDSVYYAGSNNDHDFHKSYSNAQADIIHADNPQNIMETGNGPKRISLIRNKVLFIKPY